jgi:cysteine desulfurase
VSPPAIGSSDAGGDPDGSGQDTRATNSALVNPGYRVTYLPVDREGLLNLADLEAAITDDTAVVSLMWANNESGVLFPVERIAEICQSRGVL